MVDEEEEKEYYRNDRTFSFTAESILPRLTRFSDAFKQTFSNKEISFISPFI
jgi:hypothetical protein